MKIPLNNEPELAQWYLERGDDEKANLIYGMIGIMVPLLAPIVIPIAIGHYVRGRKMIKTGEAMNAAAGRENYTQPHGFAGNQFHVRSEPVPDVRYGPIPSKPPVEPIWA